MYRFFKNINEKREKICYSKIGENAETVSFADYYDNACECLERIRETCPDISEKHVGVLADSSYEYIVALGALFMAGATIVPINIHESKENIEYIIKNADVDLLIASDRYSQLDPTVTINISGITARRNDKHYDFSDKIDEIADKTTLLIYTSGTTGRPKGVIHLLSSFLNLVEQDLSVYSDFARIISSIYITVPLYHVMGFFYWMLSFGCGFDMYLNSSAGNMLYELKAVKPNLIIATPAFLDVLDIAANKNTDNGTENLKFVISGGAKLKIQLVEKLANKGIGCYNVYGMTETAGAGTFNTDNISHADSIGIPASAIITIIDGEICISTESMMKGYYKDEAATAECLIDGYMHTGDLGYIADDGYVYITGRKKNLIILSGGENVSPEELEAKLYGNPLIRECIVYEKEDRIAADIYAPEASEEEIKGFINELNGSLPIFKRIYTVELKNCEFEKTSNGKIRRNSIH